jgi:hypothetical protein
MASWCGDHHALPAAKLDRGYGHRVTEILETFVAGAARLPEVTRHERSWWFVFKIASHPDELREELDRRTYRTRTRGERVQPPARPAGEGAYIIARHEDHTHLAYKLELPRERGRSSGSSTSNAR